jgi:hypothetical protein
MRQVLQLHCVGEARSAHSSRDGIVGQGQIGTSQSLRQRWVTKLFFIVNS